MTHKHIIGSEEVREQVINVIKNLNLEKRWDITIKQYRRNRSLEQNNLYWGWMDILAEETGNSVDACHNEMRRKFLKPIVYEWNGETRRALPSTTKLDTKEMAEYMDRIHAWAAGFGFILPLPPVQTEERA